MSDGDYVDTTDRWNQAAYFWVGLFGIVLTGAIVGIGGDNYWALAQVGRLGSNIPSVKGHALMAVITLMVGLFDLVAFGVIFAGGVILVQRVRGVSGED